MAKINVLHIVEDLKIGGIERIIATIAEGSDKEKYNIFVWCLSRGGEIAEELLEKGIRIEILGMGCHAGLSFLIKLYKKIKKARIDILHSHGYTATTVGRIAAVFAEVPIILAHVHTSFEKYTKRQILVERILNLFTDKAICCSQAVACSAKRYPKVKARDIVVIYNGINLWEPENINLPEIRKELNVLAEDYVIGCAASLKDCKGQRYLLEALGIIARLRFSNSQIPKLLLVGDGPLREDLEAYAKDLGVSSYVIFTGLRKDVVKILPAMDLVVLPSYKWEGLGISLIEAMAFGKPVIGTNTGGMPELIKNNQTGILVAPKDPESLAEAILSLLNDKEKSKRMGLAAKRFYEERFTADTMLAKLDELYRSLLKRL